MNELKSTLMLQRARRNAVHKSVVLSIRRSAIGLMLVTVLLGLTLLGLLMLWAFLPSSNMTVSPLSAVSPVQSATVRPATIISTSSPSPAPLTRVVCLSIGWVHVRFAPGDDQPVRGYLSEGETVVMDGDPGNSAWAHLSSPVVGWVDARFLCDAGERP